MSRTLHHGDKAKARKFGDRHYRGWEFEKFPTPPKRRRVQHCAEYMRTPNWWVKEMMTVPWRARARAAIQKCLRLPDFNDAPEFEKGNKPHEYYW